MRYHYEPNQNRQWYGEVYECNHPVYDKCTLFTIGEKGLAVIQQRFDIKTKTCKWTEIDPCLCNDIYCHPKFKSYFDVKGTTPDRNGLYPTVSIRQLMWALRLKPLPRERWETYFDRPLI